LFTHSGSCNLLYALFIFKQVRHTCCLSLHVCVRCIACNCMFLYVPRWLSSNAWASNPPLVDWEKLTYLVLTCHKTPINQSINQSVNQSVSQSVRSDVIFSHLALNRGPNLMKTDLFTLIDMSTCISSRVCSFNVMPFVFRTWMSRQILARGRCMAARPAISTDHHSFQVILSIMSVILILTDLVASTGKKDNI